MSKPNCYLCVHRRELPEETHSKCNNIKAEVRGDLYGVRKGDFYWPFNFNPRWLISCDGFSDNPNDNKEEMESSAMMAVLINFLKRFN